MKKELNNSMSNVTTPLTRREGQGGGSVRPKKFLGQHFLTDLKIASDIADTVDACPDIPVLEVGPGMGVMTQFLVKKPYPYNISSQIFFKMLENKELIPCCTGMIQKEVAERMAAEPGSKTYGVLSVLMQAWYDVDYLFTVHENVFNPPPKVKSAVIRLTRNSKKELGCDEKLFRRIVKTVFTMRRKMMRNGMKQILGKNHPLLADPVFNLRPEQLSVEEYIQLTNQVAEALVLGKKLE